MIIELDWRVSAVKTWSQYKTDMQLILFASAGLEDMEPARIAG